MATNRISFNCSNLVGAQAGYSQQTTWEESVRAVNDYYAPLETFPARFEEMLHQTKTLGFDLLDIWTPGQLNWRWATRAHLDAARTLLENNGIAVSSLGGDFGETRDEFLAACRMAVGVNTQLLSGGCPLLFTEREFVRSALNDFDLYLSLENHPEESGREMLVKIGNEARIGTTVDTGWYVTQGYDVVRAIQELRGRILHVHLKDVPAGDEHLNVGYGEGDVPLEASVRALKQIGYAGDYSIEEHAFDHDPTEEIKAAQGMLQSWLAT